MLKRTTAAAKSSPANTAPNAPQALQRPRWRCSLAPLQFQDIAGRLTALELPPRATKYIEASFAASSREVGEGGSPAVRGHYPSKKLGQFVNFESHTVEAIYLLKEEINPRTIAVLDQPQSIPIERVLPNGRRHVAAYTPDYLDIGDTVRAVECKPRSSLLELMQERPGDWLVGDEGVTFVPAWNALEKFGIRHEVFVPERNYQVLHANLFFLSGYVWEELSDRELASLRSIQQRVAAAPKSIAALCATTRKIEPSLLMRGIAHGLLHACLMSQQLTSLASVFLFATQAEAGQFDEAALRTLFLRRTETFCSSRVSLDMSPRAYAHAQAARAQYVQRRREGLCFSATDRKYLARIEDARDRGLPDLMAFVPEFSGRGDSRRRLSVDQIKTINTELEAHLARPNPATLFSAHGTINTKLEEMGESEVSYETVRTLFHQMSPTTIAFAQGGLRAANAARPASDPRDRSMPPLTAGQVVHIDSTLQDNRQLVELGEIVGIERPAIVAAFCSATKFCLGYALSFGPFSRFGTALLVRDIIRRWGFVPPWLMRDRGSEFINSYLQQVASFFHIGLLDRPSGDPRFGQPVEGGLKQVNFRLLRQVEGSTRNDEAGRSADGKLKSRKTASVHFHLARVEIEAFYFGNYADTPQGGTDLSPRAAWNEQRALFPVGTRAAYDSLDVQIATAVCVKKGPSRLDASRGLTIGYRRYFSEAYAQRARFEMMHEVRLDPEQPDRAYIWFEKGWEVVYSNDFATLQQGSHDQSLFELMRLSLNHKENKRMRSRSAAALDARINLLNQSALAKKVGEPKKPSNPKRQSNEDFQDPWNNPTNFDLFPELEEA